MTKNVFSVPIFLIILRETVEAGIIVSILLSFVSIYRVYLIENDFLNRLQVTQLIHGRGDSTNPSTTDSSVVADTKLTNAQLLKKLRRQVSLVQYSSLSHRLTFQ